MLVPVTGRFDPSQANRRHVQPIPKALLEQDPKRFPPVYIFNVGPRRHEFPPTERGARFLEACPKGRAHSKPLMLRNIEMEVYDLADGGGNMGRLEEEGMDKALAMIHSGAGLSLDTANLEWFGVFVTENETPTAAEIKKANEKLGAMMRLIYDQGSNKVSQNVSVPDGDRTLYNEAASFLGLKQLFGSSEHMAEECVFCHESMRAGAVLCKHCGSRQDSPEAKELRKAKV